MHEKLQQLVDNVEIIRLVIDKEAIVSIIDDEGVIQGFALPPSVKPTQQVGTVFRDPTNALSEVLNKGAVKHNYLPKEVMGFAAEGNLVPIKDGSKVVGCIICTYPKHDREAMLGITDEFQNAVNEMSDSAQDILGSIEQLFELLTGLNEKTSSVEADVNGASAVVGKISAAASRSNILALNASIEAARSGEAGRGFSVVAGEMGKLAKESGSSAGEIKGTLDGIVEHLQTIVSSIQEANDMAQSNMEGVRSIKDTLANTISLAEKLKSII